MLMIDKYSRQPIYLQLIEAMEMEILSGMLAAGERIPSVRELSLSLCVNPNTVQKALAELDRAGIIISAQGRGSFVAEDAAQKILLRSTPQLNELKQLAERLAAAGVDEELIVNTVRSAVQAAKLNKEESTQ